MGVQLDIKNAGARMLAEQVAALTGASITEALRQQLSAAERKAATHDDAWIANCVPAC